MSSSQKTASPLLVIIAFATVYIVWGSTYFFIRLGELGGMPPFLLGAARFITAGLLLMTWCIFFKGEKIFIRRDILNAAVTGLLLLLVGNGIVIWAEKTLPSAMVAILVSSAPIWFVLLDKRNWAINLTNKSTIIGLIIGFGGVILLFSDQIKSIFNGDGASKLPWMLLLIVGTISWSWGSLFSKHRPASGSASVSTAWQMLWAGVAYIPVSLIHHEFDGLNISSIQTSSWLAVTYLVIFGSIAAYNAYVWLLQVRSATQVSTYAYVNPVIAVILGVVFAHENISATQLIGLLIILLSVLLINLAKYRKEKISLARR